MSEITKPIVLNETGESLLSKLEEGNIELAKMIDSLGDSLKFSELKTWRDVQIIVRSGLAPKVFNIGDEFQTYYNNYIMSWIIIGFDHDEPYDENYTHSMTLQAKYPVNDAGFIPFDLGINYVINTEITEPGNYGILINNKPYYINISSDIVERNPKYLEIHRVKESDTIYGYAVSLSNNQMYGGGSGSGIEAVPIGTDTTIELNKDTNPFLGILSSETDEVDAIFNWDYKLENIMINLYPDDSITPSFNEKFGNIISFINITEYNLTWDSSHMKYWLNRDVAIYDRLSHNSFLYGLDDEFIKVLGYTKNKNNTIDGSDQGDSKDLIFLPSASEICGEVLNTSNKDENAYEYFSLGSDGNSDNKSGIRIKSDVSGINKEWYTRTLKNTGVYEYVTDLVWLPSIYEVGLSSAYKTSISGYNVYEDTEKYPETQQPFSYFTDEYINGADYENGEYDNSTEISAYWCRTMYDINATRYDKTKETGCFSRLIKTNHTAATGYTVNGYFIRPCINVKSDTPVAKIDIGEYYVTSSWFDDKLPSNNVPIGDLGIGTTIYLGCKYNFTNEESISWKIVDRQYKDTYNYITLMAEKVDTVATIIDGSPHGCAYDNPEPLSDITGRQTNGNGRWKYSNVRQWLNSSGDANEWFNISYEYDGTPEQYTANSKPYSYGVNTPGFLHNFSPSDLDCIVPTVHKLLVPAIDQGDKEVECVSPSGELFSKSAKANSNVFPICCIV